MLRTCKTEASPTHGLGHWLEHHFSSLQGAAAAYPMQVGPAAYPMFFSPEFIQMMQYSNMATTYPPMNPFGNPFMPMSYPSPPAQQKNYETQSSRRKSRDVSERKVSTDCRLDKSKSTSGKQPFVVPMVSGIVPKV